MTKMAECKKLISLVSRNTKCYFKDKFTFFMSLLTPIILFVLFVTFLRNIYIESFEKAFSENNLTVNTKKSTAARARGLCRQY